MSDDAAIDGKVINDPLEGGRIKNREVAFCIKTPSGVRRLLTVKERGNLDLLVVIRRAERVSVSPSVEREVKTQILSQTRFSIHGNPQSDKTNTIKLTTGTKSGLSADLVIVSTAIKIHNSYIPVCIVTPATPNSPAFILNDRSKERHIFAEYDPEVSRIFYFLLISDSGKKINIPENCPDNITFSSYCFKKFQIVLICSIYNVPSTEDGQINYLATHSLTGEADSAFEEIEAANFLSSQIPLIAMNVSRFRRFIVPQADYRPMSPPSDGVSTE